MQSDKKRLKDGLLPAARIFGHRIKSGVLDSQIVGAGWISNRSYQTSGHLWKCYKRYGFLQKIFWCLPFVIWIFYQYWKPSVSKRWLKWPRKALAEATGTVPTGPPIAPNGDPADQSQSTITTAQVVAHRRGRTSEGHVLATATAPAGPRIAPDLDSADQKGNTKPP